MANVYVDILEEIKARLDYGKASGSLTDFKHVDFYGQVRENKPRNEMPQIVIEVLGNTETMDNNSNTPFKGDFSVILNVYVDLEDSRVDNMYYNTTTEKGALYYYTYILDTLYTKSDGSGRDCRLNDTLKQKMVSSIGEFRIEGRALIFGIRLDMMTKNFDFNGRNA